MSAIVETDWGEIYTNYYDKIAKYIYRRTSNPELSEDLTSETFIKAIAADEKGNGSQTHFSGWLYRIAHNLIIDHYRTESRMQEVDLDTAYGVFDDDDPLARVETMFEFEKAQSVISQLTDDQQKVLTMRFFDERDFDEIGQVLGKNRDAVKALLFRALTNVNRLLGGEGRPGKEPTKNKEVEKVLCKHGPLTVRDIAAIANIPRTKVNSALRSKNSIFCRVGIKEDKRVTIYLWGVIGIHDKKAA